MIRIVALNWIARAIGQRLDRRPEVLEARVEALHEPPRRVLHGRVVEHAGPLNELATEEHVGRRVQIVRQGQRLVDALDAICSRVARVVDAGGRAADQDLAGVGHLRARQHLHQR